MTEGAHVLGEARHERGHHADVCERVGGQSGCPTLRSEGMRDAQAPEEKPKRMVNATRPPAVLHMGRNRKMRTPEMKH